MAGLASVEGSVRQVDGPVVIARAPHSSVTDAGNIDAPGRLLTPAGAYQPA
jgi:hypothetical protein